MDKVDNSNAVRQKPMLRFNARSRRREGSETEETEYYYYYDYYDTDASPPSSVPTPLITKDDNVQDEYYYYYYDEAESGSPSSAPSEEAQYYYYYYDQADSNSPSSSPSEEAQYYYYYYDQDDTNSPSSSPSEEAEYYYYYYDQADSNSPSSAPSEEVEYYYYYYGENSADSPSSAPSTKRDYYYYYYYENGSEAPSMAPVLSKNHPHSQSIGSLERGCEDYLLSSSMKNDVYSDHLHFTFIIRTTPSFRNLGIIAENIVESASSPLLICKSKENQMPRRIKGIFLTHFPIEEPIFKVTECIPTIDNASDCLVLKGKLFIASNKPIDLKEKADAYAVLTDTINTLHDVESLNDNISFSKYLGPSFQSQQNNIGDQVIFTLLTLSTALGILFAAMKLRGIDWKKYRKT